MSSDPESDPAQLKLACEISRLCHKRPAHQVMGALAIMLLAGLKEHGIPSDPGCEAMFWILADELAERLGVEVLEVVGSVH